MRLNKTTVFFVVLILFLLALTTFLSIFVGPILLSFLIAYLMNPFFIYLEKKGISRTISTLLSILAIILIVSTVVWIVLPIVIVQIRTIIAHIPDFNRFITQNVLPEMQVFLSQFNGFNPSQLTQYIPTLNFERISHAFLSSIGESTKFLLSSILFVVAMPVFMYIFMKHLPAFYAFISSLIPVSARLTAVDFFKEIDQRVRAVLRGQVLVVLILSFIYPIAFLISGMPTAIGIGVLVGIARLISGLDTIVAITLASIVFIVNQSSWQVVLASVIAFIVVQILDTVVITPRIMERVAGLHPAVILISIICFGYWFGIYGVLLAIPIVTILKVAFKRMIVHYKTTAFFKQ